MTNMNNNMPTKETIMNAIKASEFATKCYNDDCAFDLNIGCHTYEIGPVRWHYENGGYAYLIRTNGQPCRGNKIYF